MNALPVIDYEAHPAYANLPKDPALAEQVWGAFKPLLDGKRQSLNESMAIYAARATSSRDATSDELARNGAVGMRLASADIDRLRAASAKLDWRLSKRLAQMTAANERIRFRDTEIVLCRNGVVETEVEHAGAVAIDVIKNSGAFDIAQAYYPGYRASIHNVAIRRNVPGQGFYNVSGPGCATAGMHLDSNSRATLNGIIYLSDVGIDQGPFSSVAGSNHWSFDLEDRAIRKALDESTFGSKSGRKLFMQLPKEFQRKAAFGYDLIEDSEDAQTLLHREKRFTSDVGDLILFDGEGVHRGGDVRDGHRSSILFILGMKPAA